MYFSSSLCPECLFLLLITYYGFFFPFSSLPTFTFASVMLLGMYQLKTAERIFQITTQSAAPTPNPWSVDKQAIRQSSTQALES